MEVKFENLKKQMEETIADIIKYDTAKIQKAHLEDHATAIVIMCDTFHIITHAEAVELGNMLRIAKENLEG